MLHPVPTDRDAVLDIFAEAFVQPLALLARDVQPFLDRPRVERLGGLAINVGAGEHALLAEKAPGRIPDLPDGVGGPGDAAVDLVARLPEPLRLPAHLARC